MHITQRLRLCMGLVLFTYVTTHLLNHSLGMISLEAAESGRFWFTGFWRNPVATAVLYTSLVGHITLALWAIYRRRHLRLPRWELVRLALGLTIPLLLFQHIFSTRVSAALLGINDNYAREIFTFWVLDPVRGLEQLTLLVVAWTHGWLGVYHWLKAKPRATVALPMLRLLSLFVPLFAVLGFFDMGREVSALATDPAWVQRVYPPVAATAGAYGSGYGDSYGSYGSGYGDYYGSSGGAYGAPSSSYSSGYGAPGPLVTAGMVERWKWASVALFLAAAALTFVARPLRTAWLRHRLGLVRVTYPAGQRVAIVPGTSILEASRAADIPHASLCGGRGRCSTCRSRIGAGLATLPPPSPDEARVLKRIDAPPNVRLACQARPTADVDVFPLLPPLAGLPPDLLHAGSAGAEHEIAILFSDMRSFTRFAENRLPYDVVFLLNQYSDAMGRAIEQAGGRPNQFVGDGVMALFGLDRGPQQGCREALEGAVAMARALENLNHVLAHDLEEPLRIGIGIHAGAVIVGEMGYGDARYLTAIGDIVNTASRLETLTKEYDCQLVVAEEVALRAGVDLSAFARHEIQVRGRSSLLAIRVIPSALDLEPVLLSAGQAIASP